MVLHQLDRAAKTARTSLNPSRPRHSITAALRYSAVAAGVMGGAASAAMAALKAQARGASTTILEAAAEAAAAQGILTAGMTFSWQALPPDGAGVYLPDGHGPLTQGPAGTLVLTLLGDSTSVGYGCETADQTPAVVLAKATAHATGRPVRVTQHGTVGSGSTALGSQSFQALADGPDVVAILVGANDVRDRVSPHHAAAQLGDTVSALTELGIRVVVGTCPDLSVIPAIPQPLRSLAGVWSRRLARAQRRAVKRAGGISVSLAKLAGPSFVGHPDLFYADRFHPSGAGYALAAAALEPAVTSVMEQVASQARAV